MNEEQLNNSGQTADTTEEEIIASAREAQRQEIMGRFNPNKMKVVRKELFPSPRDPSVTFRNGNISFNAACIRGLKDVVYVNLYFDEETGLFSVTACDENDKQALRWCVAKPDKRTSRRMKCPDFTDYLFDLMGWDKKCRYKVLGYLIPFEGKEYFVFDLKVKKTFNEKPKKGEEPLDENGVPIAVDTRTGYFSGDIANTFGVPMEQHKKETEITEMDGFVNVAMFTGVREKKEGEDHSQTSTQESPPEE